MYVALGCKSNTKTDTQNWQTANKGLVTNQKSKTPDRDTAEIETKHLGCMVTPFVHGYDPQQFSPGTFNKTTYVYESLNPGATVIDTLKFNTPVNILKEYPNFYLICTPKAKAGYLKKTDLYLNKMFSSQDNGIYYYLVGVTKYPPTKNSFNNSENCEANST